MAIEWGEVRWLRAGETFARSHVMLARSYWLRARGLLGRPALRVGEGMLIAPCSSIHMFFMRYAIDVVFVDRAGQLLRLCENVRPWRARACRGAYQVVELAAGEIARLRLQRGDYLCCE